jgi:hypothetical protein
VANASAVFGARIISDGADNVAANDAAFCDDDDGTGNAVRWGMRDKLPALSVNSAKEPDCNDPFDKDRFMR